MIFLLELDDARVEVVNDGVDVLEVVLLECVKLSDGSKELDQLADTSTEEFELAEDLVRGKIELLSLWHGLKSLLRELVLFDVCFLKVLALFEHSDELIWWVFRVFPQVAVVEDHFLSWHWVHCSLRCLSVSDSSEINYVVFAVEDHLVSDFLEKSSHTLICVVVASNRMNHLD